MINGEKAGAATSGVGAGPDVETAGPRKSRDSWLAGGVEGGMSKPTPAAMRSSSIGVDALRRRSVDGPLRAVQGLLPVDWARLRRRIPTS